MVEETCSINTITIHEEDEDEEIALLVVIWSVDIWCSHKKEMSHYTYMHSTQETTKAPV